MAEQAGSTLTRHDLEAKIVKRCWEDEAFRREFISDPAGAFVRYLQIPAESIPEMVIFEETPGSWHIVLPAKPADGNELSEEELEKVAAGAIFSDAIFKSLMSASSASAAGGITASALVSLDRGW
jgi:hypothetical protein